MSFRLVNSLILEHLRWFGYQLEARILERELNVKPPNQQRPDSKLMNLLNKCIERSDDPLLYQAFEDQRNVHSSKGHLSSNQSLGLDSNKPMQRSTNRRTPAKSVGQSHHSKGNYATDRAEADRSYYRSNDDQGFSHGNGSKISNIANALRNKRNSVALSIYQPTPRSPNLPYLNSESSPRRNQNNHFDSFSGANGSSGDEGGFYLPGPNGFTDMSHLEGNQKYYSLKQRSPAIQPRKPENVRGKQVSSSYQTPHRALPYNNQSLNNSYLASLEQGSDNGYAIENPYTNAKIPSRDTTNLRARPIFSEGYASSVGYTRSNMSPVNARGPERIPVENYNTSNNNNDSVIPPSYPKGQTNNRSKLLHLSTNMNNKAGPSWRNNQAVKLGFTKEPSPFTKAGEQLSGDLARPNDKRGTGGTVAKASKGPEQHVMDYLVSNTAFSDHELRALYEAFVRINGNLELQPMDKQRFKEFASYARNIHGDHFAECLFYFGPQLSLMDGSKGVIEFKEAVVVLDKINHDNPFNLMHFIFRLSTGEEYKEANLLLVETLLKEVKAANNNGRILILLESLDFVLKDGRVAKSDFLAFEEYLEIVRGFEPMRKYC